MESRFERSFADVRVHGGELAARSAESLGAAAYALGNHIVMGSAIPASERPRILAHELAHVAQQPARAAIDAPRDFSAPNDSAEVEADRIAAAIVSGVPGPRPTRAPSRRLHRSILHDDGVATKKTISRTYVASAPISKSDLMSSLSALPDRTGIAPLNPPPKELPRQTLDDIVPPQRAPGKSLFDIAPPAHVTEKTPEPPTKNEPERRTDPGTSLPPMPVPTPEPQEKTASERRGGAVQFGRGKQLSTGPTDPDVDYTQVTLQLRDFYLISVEKLPTWLKGLSFLGDPAAQLQYNLSGTAPKTVDAQILANLVQASFKIFERKLDISVVAGAMIADVNNLKKATVGKATTPIPAGLDIEYNLIKISPSVKFNLDLQGLITDPYVVEPGKPSGRKPGVQGSGELRLVIEF